MHVARPTGTGDRKPLSVPGICWFLLLRRVQQHKNRLLYPESVHFRSSGGYSSAKTASCTRNLSIFAPSAGTAALKLLPVPVALMGERNFRNPFDGCLALVDNLKDIEFQIIRGVRRPEDGVVGCLGAKFYLAEALVSAPGGFRDGLPEQLGIHEMRAGAGCEETAVLYRCMPRTLISR